MREHFRFGYGKATLAAWQRERKPFLLYLRSFGLSVFHGDGFLLENHLWATLHPHVGVLTIADQSVEQLHGARGHGAPALVIGDDEWQGVVADLIAAAVVIVCEVPVLGDGVEFELRTCLEKGKRLHTCVIIPEPDGDFPPLDDAEVVKSFPRILHADEIPAIGAKDHFIFRDLIARARALSALDPDERRALFDIGGIEERFPITLEGVLSGYERLATEYTGSESLLRRQRTLFRALVVAGALDDQPAALRCAEEIAVIAILTGNEPLAVNYFRDALRFAERAGDEAGRARLAHNLSVIEGS